MQAHRALPGRLGNEGCIGRRRIVLSLGTSSAIGRGMPICCARVYREVSSIVASASGFIGCCHSLIPAFSISYLVCSLPCLIFATPLCPTHRLSSNGCKSDQRAPLISPQRPQHQRHLKEPARLLCEMQRQERTRPERQLCERQQRLCAHCLRLLFQGKRCCQVARHSRAAGKWGLHLKVCKAMWP